MKYLHFILVFLVVELNAQDGTLSTKFEPLDVFDLEYVSDPQISPDGQQIVYVRNYKDIMHDANRSNLWIIDRSGGNNRALTTGPEADHSPVWSPDGTQIAFRSSRGGLTQIFVINIESSNIQQLTQAPKSPGRPFWSPDGTWIAFSMNVPFEEKPFVTLPAKPKGANWNEGPKVISKLKYRNDGSGYADNEYSQIFLLPAEGGSPVQLTVGPYDHAGRLTWSGDGQRIFYSANKHEDRDLNGANSEIFVIDLSTRSSRVLTDRSGPDMHPLISPDGKKIAYLGRDEHYQGYQLTRLYIMNTDGSLSQCISCNFDRDVDDMLWSNDGGSLFIQFDDKGNTKIARISLDGTVENLVNDLGGMSLGRPYSAASFTVSNQGQLAFTYSSPNHPADLATATGAEDMLRLSDLNRDLFRYKELGEVEEIWFKSSYDQQEIQGWICNPVDFDPSKKYPLILEIHGGPFANYGDRFSAEIQLFAAAGYVVLYTNPRGSTSYGEKFGNLIHHNYPGQDYDDLMSGVDAVIEKGYIDPGRLYVTGGSGGGVLTSWIVGKTDRFKAAVVAKPVINWYSFVLYADGPGFFYKYWFPGKPWDHMEHYMKRSPISLVGNVTTPTMLLTGESDFRTPIAETEQYYSALKINGVETMMVRIPNAGHGIANQPSNLIAKVQYILGWFEKYK
ncbi:MAG: S9 family peptidase [Saprospiraceae bacterium]|nr:S9 family peptidase [Saprospiraceae bacterium]